MARFLLRPLFTRMSFDLIVVGAGLAGASLVTALKGSTLRVAIVEGRPPTNSRNIGIGQSSPAENWDARMYAVSPTNASFLTDIGIWQHLDHTRLSPIRNMRVLGDREGELAFSAYDIGADVLAWIVENRAMQYELWETLRRQTNITVYCPAKPHSLEIDTENAHLTLDDGKVLSAPLVIGADGADSWVRQQAGLDASVQPYGEQGIVANFECEKPHFDTAFQWFTAHGVLAWLPLPGRRFSIVFSTHDTYAQELLALSSDDFCQRIEQAGHSQLGPLQLITPPAAFPLRLMQVPRIVSPRIALIGDAAHAIHPLSGHGINLGFRDAHSLSKLLLALPSHRDIGDESNLRRYARARAEEIKLMQWTTHGLHELFRPKHALLSRVRNLGLNLTNYLPVVKQALIRYALG